MDWHDRTNVNRVMRMLSREWNMPKWKVEGYIQMIIDKTWQDALEDAEKKALLDKYFPDGKPTAREYILRLGHAHETGEQIPYLLEDGASSP